MKMHKFIYPTINNIFLYVSIVASLILICVAFFLYLPWKNATSSFEKAYNFLFDNDIFKAGFLNNGLELYDWQINFVKNKPLICLKDLNLDKNQTEEAKKALKIFHSEMNKLFYGALIISISCFIVFLFTLSFCIEFKQVQYKKELSDKKAGLPPHWVRSHFDFEKENVSNTLLLKPLWNCCNSKTLH